MTPKELFKYGFEKSSREKEKKSIYYKLSNFRYFKFPPLLKDKQKNNLYCYRNLDDKEFYIVDSCLLSY